MSKIKYKQLLLALLLVSSNLFSTNVSAEILVLVHGFDSNSQTWLKHGIAQQLELNGWQNAGLLTLIRPGGDHFNKPVKLNKDFFVLVDLPYKAPIQIQANYLDNYLNYLAKESPQQAITLIAHSAGGIVARLTLLNNPNLPIWRLITIATPHMGSAMAEVGEIIAKSPMTLVTPIIGADSINHAGKLLSQLKREDPGSFLFWLNNLQHPDIEYISIVRLDSSWFDGDFFVSPYSQNMNFVRGIRQSQIILTPGKHWLNFRDGLLLLQILSKGNQASSK
ncbi:MAG: hypothetical protein HQL46_02650 [Gammaproteobacteria bacterium]|nr:hypothetical protein [Gammaproteobacteria bacterium]